MASIQFVDNVPEIAEFNERSAERRSNHYQSSEEESEDSPNSAKEMKAQFDYLKSTFMNHKKVVERENLELG